MLRFPNPGSDIGSFIRIFIEIYDSLSTKTSFGLDDMTSVLIQRNLATSSGFTGEQALARSTRADRSRDPLYNQSKMYSELYKVLGWIHPLSESALNFHFTLLGAHVAAARQNAQEIFKQSILGIVYPNSIIDVSGDYVLRPFVTILRTMAMMDGFLHRDEMIVGPLCLENDRDTSQFLSMIETLRHIRGNSNRLNKALNQLEERRGITKTTMENYTRFPLAVLRWTGWATSNRVRIYERSSPFLYLSKDGYKTIELIDQLKDLRASDLTEDEELNFSIARIGFYQLLERANFDISPVRDRLQMNDEKIKNFLSQEEPQVLFSPFQELDPQIIGRIFPEIPQNDLETAQPANLSIAEIAAIETARTTVSVVNLINNQSASNPNSDEEIAKWFTEAFDQTHDFNGTINLLFNRLRGMNKEKFYPLVAKLFRFLGYECEHSRAGVNYQRWDAFIQHSSESMPIEIKSPGEEEYISVKAVRQALENKIILLARKAFPTKPTTTSLVVGYNLPNNRAEVVSLIDDIYKTYGIVIGVIDTRSLLSMVAAKIFRGKILNHQDLVNLHGIIEISYTEPKKNKS